MQHAACSVVPVVLHGIWGLAERSVASPHGDISKSFWCAVCQSLRIISFTVTQLPSPNYHCRTPELTAIKAMPEHWWGHLYIHNLKQQVSKQL